MDHILIGLVKNFAPAENPTFPPTYCQAYL